MLNLSNSQGADSQSTQAANRNLYATLTSTSAQLDTWV